jgi:hypothetical protein
LAHPLAGKAVNESMKKAKEQTGRAMEKAGESLKEAGEKMQESEEAMTSAPDWFYKLQNPQHSFFHLLCFRGEFIKSRLKFCPAMLPSHVDVSMVAPSSQ